MKKTYPFQAAGHAPERVLEAIKQDVRKYLKRERRKALPVGVDFWDFDCKVGVDQASSEVRHPEEVIPAIEKLARTEGTTGAYVEILAKPGVRTKKPVLPVEGAEATAAPVVSEPPAALDS
jgi:hypothetical protein